MMIDMSALILLRNDPGVAAEMLVAARAGNVDAQYGMGLIYAEGRGVEQDEALSFYWLSRAIEQGDEDARTLLHVITATMTSRQFEVADQLLEDYRTSGGPALRALRKRRRNRAGNGGSHWECLRRQR